MNRSLPLAALVIACIAAGIATAAYLDVQSMREEVRAKEVLPAGTVSTTAPRAESAIPTPPAPRNPPAPAPAPAEEPLRAVVRSIVSEELDARKAAATAAGEDPAGKDAAPKRDEKKPPLSQVAAVLGLTEAQKDGMKEAVIRGQREVIELLRTPMADGKVPLEEVFDVFLDDPEKAKVRAPALFGMLMTEKVPGGGETYAVRWEALKQRTTESFARDLTADQYREYEKLGLDPLEIQVPGSPWVEVLQDAFQRRRK